MSKDWTKQEVKIAIEFYFKMLTHELNGKKYNKSQFRRELKSILDNRTDGSIEFKHQNISAVLLKYNMPNIVGYQPRWNFQSLLEEEVLKYIAENPFLKNDFNNFSSDSFEDKYIPKILFEKWKTDPPVLKQEKYYGRPHEPIMSKFNYIEKEQKNRSVQIHPLLPKHGWA